jgi:hypothetical protein
MTNRIVIKKNNRVYDVFTGEEGFEPQHWTRFVLAGNGRSRTLKFIKGATLSPEDFAYVQKQLGV